MKTSIKNITSIQTGLFAKPAGFGELVYLQSKHFDENGQLQSKLTPDLPLKGISEKHLLKEGDILFAAKGSKNFATVFENHNIPSVASTSFFVLRLMNKKVLPEYLVWFMNHPNTQILLKAQAMGTAIPSISKQVIENLEIHIPDIETQTNIVAVAKLLYQEKLLKHQIESLREKQIHQRIFNAIKPKRE